MTNLRGGVCLNGHLPETEIGSSNWYITVFALRLYWAHTHDGKAADVHDEIVLLLHSVKQNIITETDSYFRCFYPNVNLCHGKQNYVSKGLKHWS